MSRIVVVSNRLPAVRPGGGGGGADVPAGGLVSSLFGALRHAEGSSWFGWSGKVVAPEVADRLTMSTPLGVRLIGMGLTKREMSDYYLGFCNEALWPLFHSFQGTVNIDLGQEACYRSVQVRFARALRPLLQPGDLVWVHDYHLLYLGRELRRLGWEGRIGFFLHIPFPSHDLWLAMPDPKGCLEALAVYDLIGFHVEGFRENYIQCCQRELNARWDGRSLETGGMRQLVGVYPVGIEPAEFLPREGVSSRQRLRGEMARAFRDRKLILGVDRLDYTKGIPERIMAFESFLDQSPAWLKRVSYVQIASPSRTEVPQYVEQRARVESLVGRVNGRLGEHDWVPIHYLYRTYSRDDLAAFYRTAAVGLVTPLRDGMNLVAKEFVVAQPQENPGVLVLSRCAGASQELPEAMMVNPYIPFEVGAAIGRALAMPLEERQQMHAALLKRCLASTASDWARGFLADLAAAPTRQAGTIPH